MDENCADYIASAEKFVPAATAAVAPAQTKEESRPALQQAIIKGFKEKAAQLTKELLCSVAEFSLSKSLHYTSLRLHNHLF
jgi:hypothetical protein